jgi:hypothetical protein
MFLRGSSNFEGISGTGQPRSRGEPPKTTLVNVLMPERGFFLEDQAILQKYLWRYFYNSVHLK